VFSNCLQMARILGKKVRSSQTMQNDGRTVRELTVCCWACWAASRYLCVSGSSVGCAHCKPISKSQITLIQSDSWERRDGLVMAMRLIMSALLMFRSKSLSATMIISANIVSSDKVDRRRFLIIFSLLSARSADALETSKQHKIRICVFGGRGRRTLTRTRTRMRTRMRTLCIWRTLYRHVTIGTPMVKNSQKQSKDSQNSKNDHWCTNRHMSTKTVPTMYQQCTNRQKQPKQSKDSKNSKNDHWCTNRHMSTQSPPNTQSPKIAIFTTFWFPLGMPLKQSR